MSLSRDETTCRECTTPVLSFQLYRQDEDDPKKLHKLHLTDLNTIALTYWNHATGAAINSRTAQDIKNANNVVIDALGRVKWTLQTADTTAVDTGLADGTLERHEAFFQWTTSAALGSKKGSERISIYVIVDSKAS